MTPQKKATLVASVTAVALVSIKLVIAILSGSVAILASAIDSILDTFISLFNFFALNKAEEKATNTYQYGKGKIQALAALFEGIIITLSGSYIIYASIDKIINKTKTEMLTPAIIAMIISIVITWFLVQYLLNISKLTNNIVIKADALHYKADLWSNGAVLIGLMIVYFTEFHFIDALIGFGIGLFIIHSAYEVIVEGVEILLDKSLNEDIVSEIEDILASHNELTSFHWLKTRTDGSINYVEFHMVLRPNILLLEAHRISDEIEDKIMLIDNKSNWMITPHFDPYDDEEMNEANFYGKTTINLKR